VNPVAPLLRIPVGVVVERRKATSPWAEFIWRPVVVLAGLPETAPGTLLAREGAADRFYAGTTDLELYRSETENYHRNLASGSPVLWVSLQPAGGDPPFQLVTVTADPAEGEGLSEAGQAIVEALPMPNSLCKLIGAFVAEYHVERSFVKRVRDRFDPETLARRSGGRGESDGR
jgi:Protein of unknown function (DUF3305)